jgi:hypothetical protein
MRTRVKARFSTPNTSQAPQGHAARLFNKNRTVNTRGWFAHMTVNGLLIELNVTVEGVLLEASVTVKGVLQSKCDC